MSRQKRQKAERWGRFAEHLAFLKLRLSGYQILERRFRCPLGEIDGLARRGRLLIVVEVKARPTRDQAIESLTPQNCQRLERALQWYLSKHAFYNSYDVRFDLIAICPKRWPFHLKDAWRPTHKL